MTSPSPTIPVLPPGELAAAAAAAAQAAAEDNFAARHVASVFEKFERDHYECQELLSQMNTQWLLSSEEQRFAASVATGTATGGGTGGTGGSGPAVDPPPGLISRMSVIPDSRVVLLVAAEDEDGVASNVDMREVHQVVRELAYGIYAFNQLPGISLEPNDDNTSSCQMSPIYYDTRVGRLMTDVDTTLKALWHGVWFPRERRIKFLERWRTVIEPSGGGGDSLMSDKETRNQLISEFTNAGLLDAATDPDYGSIYDDLSLEITNGISAPDIAAVMEAERRHFMSRVDDIALRLIFHQDSISQYNNMFVVNSNWSLTSAVRDVDPDSLLTYERLDSRLRLHRATLRKHLADKPATRRQLDTLKLIAFISTLLIAMRRRMKVPDIARMLPNMTGEETRSEREISPLIVGNDFKSSNFYYPPGICFNVHGGILIDHETPDPKPPQQPIIDAYESIMDEASNFVAKNIDTVTPYQESYPPPIRVINGKRYFLVPLDFEAYYPQPTQRPRWIHAMAEEVTKLRPKRLPITESQIHEQFKKYFGYKRAIKLRNLPQGLRMAASRGLIAMFATLSRKSPASRLGKHDETGMTLMHHAAVHNRPLIISTLVHHGQDINVRKISSVFAAGPTPLHVAVRCGSLDAVACILANGGNVLLTDERGWAPVHHAAYYDQERILRMLIRRNEATAELLTKNELKSTPLLLAASAGALQTLKCLIDIGAYVLRCDEQGNNAIHLAALRYHANILEFFIGWNHPEINVWQTLVGMLKHKDVIRKEAAVRCLEVLTTTKPEYWKNILAAGGVETLVELLKADVGNEDIPSRRLHAVIAAVLCNVSEHEPVRAALASSSAVPTLVQLLDCDTVCSESVDVASRAAVVIADLADAGDDNRHVIVDCGGIAALVGLLESNLEDILANAINALRVLCSGDDVDIRSAVGAANGAIPALVEFLSVSSEVLQAGSSAAIAALAFNHRDNQNSFISEGVVKPLVNLIKGHIINVQIKAALAVEVLADHNENSQRSFLNHDTSKALIRLLKMFKQEVKEQAALALWSLAGQTKSQQREIAETIGIPMLIEILLRDSDKLQYVGCMGMMALGLEDKEGQLRVVQQGGIHPLVRLLRVSKTTPKVMLAVIRALAALCIGVAFQANKALQTNIAEENAIATLVPILIGSASEEMRVEVAYTLACIVLCNTENLEQLQAEEAFSFDAVRNLLCSRVESVRLRAGFALAIFAFNNTAQQYAIRQAGGLGLDCFHAFLNSDDEMERATAAFQIVILARVIVDADSVELTAQGITTLVNIIASTCDDAVVHAAGLLSSLAHTRAGIPDAMLAVGALPLLIKRLGTECSEPVRHSCAVTLGYLTFNRTAARFLLAACRNTPGLYDRLIRNIGPGARISSDFIEDFKFARAVGIPCMSLEINGGPPVPTHKNVKLLRQHLHTAGPGPRRGSQLLMKDDSVLTRASSAPAAYNSRSRTPGSAGLSQQRTILPRVPRSQTTRNNATDGTQSRSNMLEVSSRPLSSAKSRTARDASPSGSAAVFHPPETSFVCPAAVDSDSFKTRIAAWQKKSV